VVIHHASHLLAAARVRRGPSNDAPDFVPAVTQAVRHTPIYRLMGDPAYDAERHHRIGREELGIRSIVIPINHRSVRRPRPKTLYRRRMHDHFPQRLYGRRWHAESAFSQHKRRLGSALTARTSQSRRQECLLRVLTHDLMILRRAS
jgi:hypothetical protein